MPLTRILLILLVCWALIEVIALLATAIKCGYYHLACPEINYQAHYGADAWMAITGGSSGQGRQLALQWASRGFHVLLIGSKRSFDVAKEIRGHYPNIQARIVLCDFSRAFEPGFFDPVERALQGIPKGRFAAMIHNVGHRVAYRPYHHMPTGLMRDTIAVGTLTQAVMTRLALPLLRVRQSHAQRSVMVFITAQCMHPTFGPGLFSSPQLCVPYLSVYEASNVFGFYHASSIWKEYRDDPTSCVEFLIITPGAVLTQNTAGFLAGAPAAVTAKDFVATIMRLTGNVEGPWSASWKQGLSLYLSNLFPPLKEKVLRATGAAIAEGLMQRDQTRKRVVN